MILCELRVRAGAPELVRIRDLSERGLKIATGIPLIVGDHVRVRLPGSTEWALARVAWRAPATAGLAFLWAIDIPQPGAARPSLAIGGPRRRDRQSLAG